MFEVLHMRHKFRKDIFTERTISKRHFRYGHLFNSIFFQGRNTQEIFSRDIFPMTFYTGH
jgi:hypothetical protein